jgi:hypothetical protein
MTNKQRAAEVICDRLRDMQPVLVGVHVLAMDYLSPEDAARLGQLSQEVDDIIKAFAAKVPHEQVAL